MHRKKHSWQNSEVRLNQKQIDDIDDLFNQSSYGYAAHSAFVNMVLACPPKVKLKTLDWDQSEELGYLLATYYWPFLKQMHLEFKKWGICAWYAERIPGSKHYIPRIPPFKSGYITTFLTEKHRQGFRWYWNGEQDPDQSVYFEKSAYLPGLDGSIRSPLSGILHDWRTAKIIRLSKEIVTQQQAHQQHIFEFHPAKSTGGDDNLDTLESFGDTIAGTVMAQQEGLYNSRMSIRKDELKYSLYSATMANQTSRQRQGMSVYTNTDTPRDQWERDNANLLERAMKLPPDFVYKSVPSPSVSESMEFILQRVDRSICLTMDIPYQLIETVGGVKTSASVQGNIRFVNERMKDWNGIFITVTHRILLILYGHILQEGLRRISSQATENPARMLELFADSELEVYLPCTPLANVEDLIMMEDRQYMDKRTAAEHVFNALGLPHADLSPSLQ